MPQTTPPLTAGEGSLPKAPLEDTIPVPSSVVSLTLGCVIDRYVTPDSPVGKTFTFGEDTGSHHTFERFFCRYAGVFLKGTLLTICCAATRAMLFLHDFTRVPFECLDHWWDHAFGWVVRHAGDCSFDRAQSLLFGDSNETGVQRHDAESSTNIADCAFVSRRS